MGVGWLVQGSVKSSSRAWDKEWNATPFPQCFPSLLFPALGFEKEKGEQNGRRNAIGLECQRCSPSRLWFFFCSSQHSYLNLRGGGCRCQLSFWGSWVDQPWYFLIHMNIQAAHAQRGDQCWSCSTPLSGTLSLLFPPPFFFKDKGWKEEEEQWRGGGSPDNSPL